MFRSKHRPHLPPPALTIDEQLRDYQAAKVQEESFREEADAFLMVVFAAIGMLTVAFVVTMGLGWTLIQIGRALWKLVAG